MISSKSARRLYKFLEVLSHQPTVGATEPTAVQKDLELGCFGLLTDVMVKAVAYVAVEFFSLLVVFAAVENEVMYVFVRVTTRTCWCVSLLYCVHMFIKLSHVCSNSGVNDV